jgi:hypothetical protein
MAFFSELDRPMTLSRLVQLFESKDLPESIDPEESPLWYEEVAVKIIEEHGGQGLDYLLSSMPKWDEQRLRGVLLSFCFLPADTLNLKRAMLVDLLLSYLHDSRPQIIANAIRTLRHLDCQDALVPVLRFVNHSSPFIQGAALSFLSKCDFSIARPLLFAALESPSPIVRQIAIDELDESLCVDAIPKIRDLLLDKDPDVRLAAQTAIENLIEIA